MPSVAIDRIAPDPKQPRKTFLDSDIEERAASILANGLIQPIIVRVRDKAKGMFWLWMGETRWRAHHLLVQRGHTQFRFIEVIVRSPKDAADIKVQQIIENAQRAEVPLLEEAQAYADLAAMGLTEEEAARRCGVDVGRIRSRLNLLNLAPELVTLFKGGQLEKQHALELCRLPNHDDQVRLLQMINRGDISGQWHSVRRAVDALVEQLTQTDMFGEEPVASPADVAAVNAMEQRIERAAKLLAPGWEDGACIVAVKVSPDRANHLADKIAAIRTSCRHMENELRHVTAQARIVLTEVDHAT